MALVKSRRGRAPVDYWPGFVDALSTLLLVIIFLLSLFMLSQFFLSQELSGRETALERLNAQIAELSELLALERAGNTEQAAEVGKALAAAAKKAGVERCVFDRGGYLFHGRVKALAEGAREGGLQL